MEGGRPVHGDHSAEISLLPGKRIQQISRAPAGKTGLYPWGRRLYNAQYWAHLILVGNTDPITIEENNNGLKWGLIAGLFTLIPLLIGWRGLRRKPRLLHTEDPKV